MPKTGGVSSQEPAAKSQDIRFKLTHNNVTKRVKRTPDTFQSLRDQAEASFGALSPDFKFYYVDEDEDEILLLNDSDLKAAIEYARNNGNALKVFMKGEVQEEVKEEVPLAESRIS